MKPRIAVVLLFISAFSAMALADANADPTGMWKVTRTWMPGAKDERKDELTLVLKLNGQTLSGRAIYAEGDEAEVPITSAEFKDGRLSFKTHRRGWTTDWTGKVNGETMSGGIAVFLATGTWEGKRVTPPDALR